MASQRSLRGLDWFAFFVADVQTGWGPFVATYLTSVAWTQFDIGLILTIGTITGLALQIPAGMLVDRVLAKRLLAALAVASISASALLLALWPIFSMVVAAKVLHAIASSLLGPTLVAMSLGLVGHALFSIRLGRNVRFLSLGNAIAAGVAGGIAYYYSNQAIFFLTAALGIPTLIALAQISSSEIDPELARGKLQRVEMDRIPCNLRPRPPSRAHWICRHDRTVSACQRSDAANPGRDIGKAGPGNGGLGAINRFSAAVRGRSHRTVDRSEGAELGSSPAFAAYLRRAVGPRCNIRGNKRPLFARCGATS